MNIPRRGTINRVAAICGLTIFFVIQFGYTAGAALAFSSQPKSQYSPAGTSATLTASAFSTDGLPPYSVGYQWQFYSTNLPGASGLANSQSIVSLSLTNLQPANTGPYRIIFTNAVTSITSADAVLVVGQVAVWATPSPIAATNIPLDATNIIAVATGGNACSALRNDGTVTGWGTPSVPPGLSNVIEISGNAALRSDGAVTVWGDNTYGQVNVPADLTNTVAISSGATLCMALKDDGTVRVWGNSIATSVPAGLKAVRIAAGSQHCLALTPQGTVKAWGNNVYGQINVPANLSGVVAISAGLTMSMALKSDGTVAVWGPFSSVTNVPASVTNIVAITAGDSYCLALRADGVLLGWGGIPLLNVPKGFTNIISTAASPNQVVALCNSGEPVLTVNPTSQSFREGQPVTLNSLAIGAQPLAYQWQLNGTNIPGATGASLTISSSRPNDSGIYTLIVSNSFGSVTGQVAAINVQQQVSVAVWGDPFFAAGLPAGMSNIAAISANGSQALALFDNGQVRGWGWNNGYESVKPPNATNIVAIASGTAFQLALKADGSTLCWGFTSDTTFTNNTTFPPFSGFTAIAAGAYHKVGLTPYGTVQTKTDAGGDLITGSLYMQPPSDLSNVKAIAAGYYHNLALKNDGTVVAWAAPNSGLVTNLPPGLTNVSAIACGYQHDLALLSNGTVVAWGFNAYGQTNVPPGLTNVIAIAAHMHHSLALKSDGTVVAWGLNDHGECAVPPGLTNVTAIAAGNASVALVGNSAACVSMPPHGLTLSLNSTGTLQSAVCGSSPVYCQWLHEGVTIPGATNLSLTFSNFQTADAGNYALVASNALGVVTSQWAAVTLGPIVTWGLPGPTLIPSGITNPVAVSAQNGWSAALDASGGLTLWGSFFPILPSLTNAVSFGTGLAAVTSVADDGSVMSWASRNYPTEPPTPLGLPPISATAAGVYHRLALSTDGRVFAWGNIFYSFYNYGQTNIPIGLSNVVAIAAGDYHSVALRDDGTVVCWGNVTSTPPNLTNVVAIGPGGTHTLALKGDGTLTAWGNDDAYGTISQARNFSNVVAVSISLINGAAVTSDGGIKVWGNSGYGVLTPPSFVHNVIAAAAGQGQIVAILGDGSPRLTIQPFNHWPTAGSTITLQAMAVGTPPLGYQWLLNGIVIPGATNSALTLPNLHLGTTSGYQCVVSNALGSATSSAATVNVSRGPLQLTAINNADTSVTLHLTGLAETGPVVFYSSTNLVNWIPISTNGPVLGTLDFVDDTTDAPLKFYKASEQQ